ncbi:hypothetical protein EVAR_74039_1 [Eumeta japonica]|uniref:Uncharacterized protein n=1 Tax=Eumeta variegata TaxID=151549 RepID=A0A4C1SQD4_EUMVA|nr:hypothetical protein EVAR_74039_1 [Eumeta japonica]
MSRGCDGTEAENEDANSSGSDPSGHRRRTTARDCLLRHQRTANQTKSGARPEAGSSGWSTVRSIDVKDERIHPTSTRTEPGAKASTQYI